MPSLGLGFSGRSSNATMSFWEAAIASNRLAAPEMGFWFARIPATPGYDGPVYDEPGGAFTFGGVDTSYYSGDIEFLPVASNTSTYWTLNISGEIIAAVLVSEGPTDNVAVEITVDGSPIVLPGSTRMIALDTGVPLFAGPPADVAAIYAAIPGASIYDNSGLYQFRARLPAMVHRSSIF